VGKMFKSTEHDDKAVMTTEASQSDRLDAEFANSSRQVRELAHRDNNELHVTLLWHPVSDAPVVRVWDERHGAQFEIRPEPDTALEAFYHPYAYTPTRGPAASIVD
jgi:hypothetical protein